MRIAILLMGILGITTIANAQKNKPKARVEKVDIIYNGKPKKARKLTVYSEIPMPIASAWANVKTPALLQFVAKGMIKFRPTEGAFPPEWILGSKYGAKMRVFGFIPFGGTHYLFIETIDDINYTIATKEWDNTAKVWNHKIVIKELEQDLIAYEDTITIFGGIMTGFITSFARRFYIHRQTRWQTVAKKNLHFSK